MAIFGDPHHNQTMVLTPELLLRAYANGFFPMGDPDTKEIHWYRPDPRAVLPLENFHRSRSLVRKLRKESFVTTFNQDFASVIRACRRPDTWITDEIVAAYEALHQQGHAHSVEVCKDGNLVGGVYGVSLAGGFFAESMFHSVTDASKVALHHLVDHLLRKGFCLLEVQFLTPHLASLGAVEISDKQYQTLLKKALTTPAVF
ncbi:MAG: leucyl/phenylalanyl-tRNA--protein transferase [Bdellovibrionales bacterium]|nr:leucyl/phenylalanyl-tRNA--protein transferase [Bdellovibrionales bacterium]